MMKQWIAGALCTVAAFGAACEKLDHAPEKYLQDPPPTRQISLEEVAQLLSSLPSGRSSSRRSMGPFLLRKGTAMIPNTG